MNTTCWPKEPLLGEDVDLLDRILRTWCATRGVDLADASSCQKAKELVEWFEFGVRDPAELARLIGDGGI